MDIKKLSKTLSSGLQGGAQLQVEDLNLSCLGLYKEKDVSVPDSDYFPAEEIMGPKGVGYLMRKSEEGVKWHTFQDTHLKLHKILKKD